MLRPAATSLVSRRFVIPAIALAFTLWYLTIHDTSFLATAGGRVGEALWKGGKHVHSDRVLQDQFVAKVLDHDIYVSEYDGRAVRKVCRQAKWRDDVVMSCDMLGGGIGNLKVNLLACLRYAIESGARLIPPVIHVREQFGLMANSFNWEKGNDLSYMFDTEHLYTTLAADCPQLRFVDERNKSLNIPPKKDALSVNPKTLLAGDLWYKHVMNDPSKFRPALDTLIKEEIKAKNLEPSADKPLRLSFNDGISFSWPSTYDGPEFKSDWGHLARWPLHIRALSARILYRLYQTLAEQGFDNVAAQQQHPDRPSRNLFLGAHIRTESDATVESWTSFEKQAAHVREQVLANNLSVVYVATGTASTVDQLRTFLADVEVPVNNMGPDVNGTDVDGYDDAPLTTRGVQVLQKWDFMDDEDLMLVDSLTWDQMALIDLDVMLRSSRFVGIWESSWTWIISLKRHDWSEEDPYDFKKHPVTFEDQYSIIYGVPGAQGIIDPCSWL